MGEKSNERKVRTRVQPGDVRVYTPQPWLTRRFVIAALSVSLIFGPLWSVIIYTAADQYIRNTIDEWMSDPDLYETLTLKPEEFGELPVHWRQVLAEIATRPRTDAAGLQKLAKELGPEEIALIDRIAPYVSQDFLVRDQEQPSRHPMPTLKLIDFVKLEEMGVLQDVTQGLEMTFTVKPPSNQPVFIRGSTALVSMQSAEGETNVKIPITRLTAAGAELVKLLRTPSDIRFFEWVAKKVQSAEVESQVWALGAGDDATAPIGTSAGKIERLNGAPWPG